MSKQVPRTYIYKMYYTFCTDPACGALNDYADDRVAAEENRKRHASYHLAENAAALERSRKART